MGILDVAKNTFEAEQPITAELASVAKVMMDISEDPSKAEAMLSQHLDSDPFKIKFFLDYVLGSNSRLCIAELSGKKLLAIQTYNLDLKVNLFLPIKAVKIDNKQVHNGLPNERLIAEEVDITIEYEGLIWSSENTNPVSFVEGSPYTLRYISFGKRIQHSSDEKAQASPRFISYPNSLIQKRSSRLNFQIALPIDNKTIVDYLHEIGHYFDVYIAGNTIFSPPHFKLIQNLSTSGLNFVPPTRPLASDEIQALVDLKKAEVRAWLYASHLLGILGINMNFLENDECINSLRPYDRLLAPQVLSAVTDDLPFFIYNDIAEEQRKWRSAYTQLENLILQLSGLNMSEHHFDDIDVTITPYKSNGARSIQIVGDDTTLQFSVENLGTANIIWVNLILNSNGQELRERFMFNLNNSNDLKRCGQNTFLNWIDILGMFNTRLINVPVSK